HARARDRGAHAHDHEHDQREKNAIPEFRNFESIRESGDHRLRRIDYFCSAGAAIVPPAFSIFSRALALTLPAVIASFFVNSPMPRILTPSYFPRINFASSSAASSTVAPFSKRLRSFKLTIA